MARKRIGATAMLLVATLWSAVPVAAGDGVADSPQEIHPLLIGASVPGVTLKTGDGSSFDLGAAIAQKPTILIVYRGGW